MKKLLIILVFCFVCSSTVGVARADGPFTYLSVPQKKIDLGTILIWDTVIPEAVTLKVNSNCMHGSIVASISSLKNIWGPKITQDRIFIKTPYTGDFISMVKPVIISGPMFGPHDIPIDFKVKANTNGVLERAGKYSGTIVFTILPPIVLDRK